MKLFTGVFFSFLMSCSCLFAQNEGNIFFVRPDGPGDGTSWAEAASDLAAVLRQAEAGDQVWVATGTYKPTADSEREASFELNDGVRVFGGFRGSESTAEQRDWLNYPTVLSGEIGDTGYQDNSFSVIYTENVSDQTLLDGFIVTGGNANGQSDKGGRIRCGGGWFNNGSKGKVSHPVIRNCTFTNNHGFDGAAFYNYGESGSCAPRFVNCTFSQNQAELDGGAIFNDGRRGGDCRPVFKNCNFVENMASYGAAIFAENENGQVELNFQNCLFKENMAYLWGGGIFTKKGEGELEMNIGKDCKFHDNYPTDINKSYNLSRD